MIRFLENYSLKTYSTFGVDVAARYFFDFTDVADLSEFLTSNKTWGEEKILVLGGGSNILFTKDFDGLVIRPAVPGITIVKEDRQNVWIEVGAGEVWDEFVEYCVYNEFYGVENLSLIPGSVGAVPVQNIGAYGVEVAETIELVKGFDLSTLSVAELNREECHFGYRDSIFKKNLKNRFIVTSVVFKLEKFAEFKLDYGDVKAEVEKLGEVNIYTIRKAIVDIRSAKLPDEKVIGNAGSFFKNPVVTIQVANDLKIKFPEMPVYPFNEKFVKLAAGWLIDQCGLKGFRDGNVGVHKKQALVIVNYGGATGSEIYDLSEKIKQLVHVKFDVVLEREVNCI